MALRIAVALRDTKYSWKERERKSNGHLIKHILTELGRTKGKLKKYLLTVAMHELPCARPVITS